MRFKIMNVSRFTNIWQPTAWLCHIEGSLQSFGTGSVLPYPSNYTCLYTCFLVRLGCLLFLLDLATLDWVTITHLDLQIAAAEIDSQPLESGELKLKFNTARFCRASAGKTCYSSRLARLLACSRTRTD